MSTSSSNEIGRFMALRPVNKSTTINVSGSQNSSYFIHYSDIEFTSSFLYGVFVELQLGNEPREEYLDRANDFYENAVPTYSSEYIGTIRKLYEAPIFHKFDLLEDWLQNTANAATTVEEAQEFIASVLTAPDHWIDVPDYLLGKVGVYSNIWDNLFAQYISPANLALRQELTTVIKLYNLIQRLVDFIGEAGTTLLTDVFDWHETTVILPHAIFPIPGQEYDTSQTPIAEDPGNSSITDAINLRRNAVKELIRLKRNQLQDRNLPLAEIGVFVDGVLQPSVRTVSSSILTSEYVSQLTTETIDLLASLGITDPINVDHAIERINESLSDLYDTTAQATHDTHIVVGNMVMAYEEFCITQEYYVPTDPCGMTAPSAWPANSRGMVSNIGVADLMVIEKKWQQYETGEIAHVENVLLGEKRVRTHKRLDRTEETFEFETETTTENETETQTNERFQLDKETAEEQSKQSQIAAGVSVTANYGAVKATGDFRYSQSNSKSSSDRTASSYSKDIINKAISRVKKRVRESKKIVRITQVEETNEHSFNNEAGTGNISGRYRFLNEKYECTLRSYGKRLMLEFVVPEPASFYIFSKAESKAEGSKLKMPVDPKKYFEKVFGAMSNPSNTGGLDKYYEQKIHLQLAKELGAVDVTPPPERILTVCHSYKLKAEGDPVVNTHSVHAMSDFKLPAGYRATKAEAIADLWNDNAGDCIGLLVGNKYKVLYDAGIGSGSFDLSGETDTVPVSAYLYNCKGAILNIEVQCEPTEAWMEAWFLKTHKSIMAAYERKLAEYNDALSNLQAESITFGNNPSINREVEKTELKKRSLEIMTGQRFSSFESVAIRSNPLGFPEIRFEALAEEAQIIKFFEMAFEWEQMTYTFYPYFWGNKKRWVKVMQLSDDDPLFGKFLQSGAARVVVPVDPAYEDAVWHYLQTGEFSTLNQPLATADYVQYKNDLKKREATIIDQWVVSVPTNLVVLDDLGSPLPENPDHELPL